MKTKFFLALATIACLPLCAFSQFTLRGIVKDKTSGDSLAGTTVLIENTFLSTMTGPEGKFQIPNLKAGNYSLRISFIGYETIRQDITLESDKDLNFSLTKKEVYTDEAVVTATRAASSTQGTYSNVDYKAIEKQNLGQDLPYLLNMTPSLVVTSDAGAGVGYTGIHIRGSDGSRVNVTINGIPVNDAESQGTYWVDIPDLVSSADNIQVQRGIGTSTNGAGAFGGSVNIKTTGLNEKAYGEISNSYGSFNTMKSTLKIGSGLIDNKFAFDGRFSRTVSDGYIDRASSNLKSFYVSGGYFGKKTVLKLIAFSGVEKTYQAWYGVPQDSLKTHRTFNPAGMYVDSNGDIQYYKNETDNYQQDYYQLHLSQELNSRWNFNAALHYTYGRGYYEEYRPAEALASYGIQGPTIGFITVDTSNIVRRLWLNNDFYGFTYSLNYSDNKKTKFTLGGAGNKYIGRHYNEVTWTQFAGNSFIGQQYGQNNAEKTDFTVFGKLNYSFTSKFNGFVDLQYRAVSYTFTGFDEKYLLSDQTVPLAFFNPKAGLNYDVAAGKNLYAFLGIGNKEPSRDDYVNSSVYSRPKPESMQDLELGYRQKNKNSEFGINGFWMNYKNQLVLTGRVNDVGAYNRMNVDKSFREGIELDGGVKFFKQLQWNANFTYSLNKIKNFVEYIDNYDTGGQDSVLHGKTDISFSPGIIAGSKFTFTPHKNILVAWMSKYIGEQFLDNSSNSDRKLKAYFVNDLLLSWTLHPKWIKEVSFNFLINNFLDQKYESNGWVYSYISLSQVINQNNYYPQAGRNYLGGITLKF